MLGLAYATRTEPAKAAMLASRKVTYPYPEPEPEPEPETETEP